MIPMDGVLIINKPVGLTSHDVVARVRRILSERRVGHTGTLDPFATGVLVILVGRATRLAQFLSGADKEYEAVIRFGYATDTGDLTGTRKCDVQPATNLHNEQAVQVPFFTPDEIESALAKLRGEIDQIPPMYSAKKVKGRKLYELARAGEEIKRQPVRIIIHEFEALQNGNELLTRHEDGCADLEVRVVCSAGTYVRALAEDLGRQLASPAHLVALKRTRAGDFKIENALSLEELQDRVAGNTLESSLIPLDAALSRLQFVHLIGAAADRVRHGMLMQIEAAQSAGWRDGEEVRMRDEDGNLLAVGVFDRASETLHPKVVLVT
jgi:tRNA pseudouridine55 synthase